MSPLPTRRMSQSTCLTTGWKMRVKILLRLKGTFFLRVTTIIMRMAEKEHLAQPLPNIQLMWIGIKVSIRAISSFLEME